MQKLFIDTSAWYALADPKDDNHQSAIAYRNQIGIKYRLVSTNYVFDELYTLLLLNVGYGGCLGLKGQLDLMIEGDILDVVWVSEAVERESWKIFERYNVDKEWSFTDCTSYAIMKQWEITEVFTFDRHFNQMGFIKRP